MTQVNEGTKLEENPHFPTFAATLLAHNINPDDIEGPQVMLPPDIQPAFDILKKNLDDPDYNYGDHILGTDRVPGKLPSSIDDEASRGGASSARPADRSASSSSSRVTSTKARQLDEEEIFDDLSSGSDDDFLRTQLAIESNSLDGKI